ncbi:MAG: hypothetical protein IK121_05090 [Lachnospiraceae bacterium]|nr:hypothetical protein [Lachnospiraceae bacterium]MBR5356276.1 hypothetical protein [Lachnospiraceae bacterium]
MGFFKNLFKGKKENVSTLIDTKEELDLDDAYIREQYVLSCLEQMKEASEELDKANAEYSLVTSYLTDMEEIEAIEGDEKTDLCNIAKRIHDLRQAHDKYVLTPSLMSEHDFNHLDSIHEEAKEGIDKLLKEEDYRKKVKADLKRVERERDAYSYRRNEVRNSLENIKGIATISIISAVILVLILFLLQVLLELDVVLGYYIAVLAIAILMTVVYVKYSNYTAEKGRIDKTINDLILLQNKVKIRYVNNKNLLDYLYAKYEVSSAAELKDLYEKYLKEKEDRRAFARNEAAYDEEITKLLKRLKAQRIKDPEIWVHQTDAIYDNREMVEIRHSLIQRRQKIRKQVEYNEQIALEASDEIKDLMRRYPQNSESIMDLVNKYGQN